MNYWQPKKVPVLRFPSISGNEKDFFDSLPKSLEELSPDLLFGSTFTNSLHRITSSSYESQGSTILFLGPFHISAYLNAMLTYIQNLVQEPIDYLHLKTPDEIVDKLINKAHLSLKRIGSNKNIFVLINEPAFLALNRRFDPIIMDSYMYTPKCINPVKFGLPESHTKVFDVKILPLDQIFNSILNSVRNLDESYTDRLVDKSEKIRRRLTTGLDKVPELIPDFYAYLRLTDWDKPFNKLEFISYFFNCGDPTLVQFVSSLRPVIEHRISYADYESSGLDVVHSGFAYPKSFSTFWYLRRNMPSFSSTPNFCP